MFVHVYVRSGQERDQLVNENLPCKLVSPTNIPINITGVHKDDKRGPARTIR